jgi:hypothetical protein
MNRLRACAFAAALLLFAPSAVAAQNPLSSEPPELLTRDSEGQTTIRAVRVMESMRIDGALDEPLYALPSMADFTQVEPQLGAPATERTEVWLGFDPENVYISFRVWDSQPERRVTKDLRRDGSAMFSGDDVVYFFLDTFYDRRNGASFTINSLGGRSEGQVTGDQYNADWNPIYDLATGRFDGGWTVEVALPFKSLRYARGAGADLGIQRIARPFAGETRFRCCPGATMARTELGAPAATGRDCGRHRSTGRIEEARDQAVRRLERHHGRECPAADLERRDRRRRDGCEVQPDTELVADFTYNTDFAQVEADEQQINLTRFSLFFPEKREFFLENQGTFAFGGSIRRAATRPFCSTAGASA